MRYYAGLDVSLAETSVCVVDDDGRITKEAKIASEPEALATWRGGHGLPFTRVGLETGSLAGRHAEEMTELSVPDVVCMDAGHACGVVAMTHKADRNDARGLAHSSIATTQISDRTLRTAIVKADVCAAI